MNSCLRLRRSSALLGQLTLNLKSQSPKRLMQNIKLPVKCSVSAICALMAVVLFAGCQSGKEQPSEMALKPADSPATPAAPAVSAAPAAPAAPKAPPAPAVAPATVTPPVRIKAGPSPSFKDADGNAWLPDQAFADGDNVERPDIDIANTKTPAIYRSERYSMTSFSYPVPNGKYLVKLHFAETYEGINGPGERVFSFNVQGHEFNDFDVWVKAGGPLRAYVETVPVEVTNGKVEISFTPKVENPQINGIEILPAQ
jgi:hypothetical protein